MPKTVSNTTPTLTYSKRLTQWFNNHTRATTSEQGKQHSLNLMKGKPKLHPVYQAYSALYYKSCIKAVVDEKWAEMLQRDQDNPPNGEIIKLTKAAPLWFSNKVTKWLLSEESIEVIVEVEK